MLTPEQIAALRDWAGHIADPINDFLLEDIARRIAKAGQLTSSASYRKRGNHSQAAGDQGTEGAAHPVCAGRV